MTSTIVDLVKVLATSTGSGAFTLGGAVFGFRGTDALVDGNLYGYAVQSSGEFEVGRGAYVAATGQLTRSPIASSNGNAPVPFPANVEISFVLLAEDLDPVTISADAVNAYHSLLTVYLGGYADDAAATAAAVGLSVTFRTGSTYYNSTSGKLRVATVAGSSVTWADYDAAAQAAATAANASAMAAVNSAATASTAAANASNSAGAAAIAAAFQRVLPATPSALPYEVRSLTGGAAGTGGTPGVYKGGVSGSGFPGFEWSVIVSAAGTASYVIDKGGLSTSNTAPTLVMPSGTGLTGASVPTAVTGVIGVGTFFSAPTADGLWIGAWGNNAGTLATAPFGLAQLQLSLLNQADAAIAIFSEYGRGPASGVNLLDMVGRGTAGQAINTDGTLFASASNTLSDPMRVKAGSTYIVSKAVGHKRELNAAGAYIAGTYSGAIAAGATFTTNAAAAYVQVDMPTATISRSMLLAGTVLPSLYLAPAFLDPASDKRAAILNARAVVRTLSPQTIQLFDKTRRTDNTAMGGTGVPYALAGWFTTGAISVDPGQTYIVNETVGGGGGAMYNEDGGFIRLFGITSGVPFVIPADCFFVNFQVNGLAKADTIIVAEGSTLPSYAPFQSPKTLGDSVTQALSSTAILSSKQPSFPNMFDLRTGKDDFALSNINGAEYAATGNFYTGVMAVTPGQTIFVTCHNLVSGNFLAVWRNSATVTGTGGAGFVSSSTQALDTAITVPSGCFGLQISVSMLRRRQSLHACLSSTKPLGYVPYVFAGPRPKQDAQIVLLGDSFTDPVATAGGWTPYFINLTGATVLANYAKAGRVTRNALKTYGEVDLTAADFTNATDVLIPLGTNDYGASRALGAIADAASGYAGPGSFYNDVFMVLTTLYGFKKTLRVAWVTPTIRGNFVTTPAQPFYPAANSAGVTLPQYRDAIIEVCALFGTPVIDMFRISGFNLLNIDAVTDDLLHPNVAVGQPKYGTAIARSWNAT